MPAGAPRFPVVSGCLPSKLQFLSGLAGDQRGPGGVFLLSPRFNAVLLGQAQGGFLLSYGFYSVSLGISRGREVSSSYVRTYTRLIAYQPCAGRLPPTFTVLPVPTSSASLRMEGQGHMGGLLAAAHALWGIAAHPQSAVTLTVGTA